MGDPRAKDRMESMGRPRPSKPDADSNSNLGRSPGIGITETKAYIMGSQEVGSTRNGLQLELVPHPPTGLTYGGNKGGIEGIIRKTKKDACLPHSRVSDQEQLEKQVVRLLRHWEERLRRSPPAAPRDRSLSLWPTPHSGVLRPEDRGSVGKKEGSRGRGRPTNGFVKGAPMVAASGASEGGDRGSTASPSRSARFRGVGRDKMASPPPSGLLGRDAPTGERTSSAVGGARRA